MRSPIVVDPVVREVLSASAPDTGAGAAGAGAGGRSPGREVVAGAGAEVGVSGDGFEGLDDDDDFEARYDESTGGEATATG